MNSSTLRILLLGCIALWLVGCASENPQPSTKLEQDRLAMQLTDAQRETHEMKVQMQQLQKRLDDAQMQQMQEKNTLSQLRDHWTLKQKEYQEQIVGLEQKLEKAEKIQSDAQRIARLLAETNQQINALKTELLEVHAKCKALIEENMQLTKLKDKLSKETRKLRAALFGPATPTTQPVPMPAQ